MRNVSIIAIVLMANILFGQNVMPNIILKTMDGQSVNVTDTDDPTAIKVFAFWATWCGPCLEELDAYNYVYDDWKDEVNVEIIAVSIDDSKSKRRVRPLVNGKDWEFKVLLDDNQELKRALNISNVPHVIVVKDNVIVHRSTSYAPGAEDELFEILQEYSN